MAQEQKESIERTIAQFMQPDLGFRTGVYYKVTEPGLATNVDLVNEGTSEDCYLRMLLVGGGGQ